MCECHRASPEVETLARGYMQIRIWSAPAAISVFGITGWLIAQERTRAVLVLQVWMNGINVLLNLWFVLGLGWGVNGVAPRFPINKTAQSLASKMPLPRILGLRKAPAFGTAGI